MALQAANEGIPYANVTVSGTTRDIQKEDNCIK